MDNFYWNLCFDKSRIKTFISWYLLNNGEFKTVALLDQLKSFGFESATKAGISLGIDDLKIPPKKKRLLYEAEIETTVANQKYKRGDILGVEKFQRLISSWHRVSETLKTEVVRHFEETNTLNPVYMMAFSGARGNISQVRQLVGMRGLMSDPQGRIIDFPILRNFREGLTLTEYLISCFGARKGIVDTALRTANAGYLTRRLVDVAHHVIISQFDCGTTDGIGITPMKEGAKYIYTLQNRIVGRVAAETIIHEGKVICSKNDELTQDLALKIASLKTKVFIRSPLTCDSKNLVCQLCYGWSLADGRLVSIGETVGIIAAQSIGEPGTQLTMRTFHTGGVFTSDVSDQIKAPYTGIVDFDAPIQGSLVRTAEGTIGFLTKTEGRFSIRQISQLGFLAHKQGDPSTAWPPREPGDSPSASPPLQGGPLFGSKGPAAKGTSGVGTPQLTKYKIPALTLLFIRHQQRVMAKELIAQITSINQQTAQRDNSEQTLLSELEGEILFANIRYRQSSESAARVSPFGGKELSVPHRGDPSCERSVTDSPVLDKYNKSRGAKMEVWTTQKQEPEVVGEHASPRSPRRGPRGPRVDSSSRHEEITPPGSSYQIGSIWLLSGKIYQFPIKTKTFLRTRDYITKKTPLNEIIWHKTGSSLTIQNMVERFIPNTLKEKTILLSKTNPNKRQNRLPQSTFRRSATEPQILESFIYRKHFVINKISYKNFGYLVKLNHKRTLHDKVSNERRLFDSLVSTRNEKSECFLFLTTAFANETKTHPETVDGYFAKQNVSKKTAYEGFQKNKKEGSKHTTLHMYDRNRHTPTGGLLSFENIARFGDMIFTSSPEVGFHHKELPESPLGKLNLRPQNKKIENWIKKAIFMKNILKLGQDMMPPQQGLPLPPPLRASFGGKEAGGDKKLTDLPTHRGTIYPSGTLSRGSTKGLSPRERISARTPLPQQLQQNRYHSYYKQFPLSKKEILIHDYETHCTSIPLEITGRVPPTLRASLPPKEALSVGGKSAPEGWPRHAESLANKIPAAGLSCSPCGGGTRGPLRGLQRQTVAVRSNTQTLRDKYTNRLAELELLRSNYVKLELEQESLFNQKTTVPGPNRMTSDYSEHKNQYSQIPTNSSSSKYATAKTKKNAVMAYQNDMIRPSDDFYYVAQAFYTISGVLKQGATQVNLGLMTGKATENSLPSKGGMGGPGGPWGQGDLQILAAMPSEPSVRKLPDGAGRLPTSRALSSSFWNIQKKTSKTDIVCGTKWNTIESPTLIKLNRQGSIYSMLPPRRQGDVFTGKAKARGQQENHFQGISTSSTPKRRSRSLLGGGKSSVSLLFDSADREPPKGAPEGWPRRACTAARSNSGGLMIIQQKMVNRYVPSPRKVPPQGQGRGAPALHQGTPSGATGGKGLRRRQGWPRHTPQKGSDAAYPTETTLNIKHCCQDYNVQVKKGIVYLPRNITGAFRKHKSFNFPGQCFLDDILFSTVLYSECFKLTQESVHMPEKSPRVPPRRQGDRELDCFANVILTNTYCRFKPQICPRLPFVKAKFNIVLAVSNERLNRKALVGELLAPDEGTALPLSARMGAPALPPRRQGWPSRNDSSYPLNGVQLRICRNLLRQETPNSACSITNYGVATAQTANFFVLIRNIKTIKQEKTIDRQINLSKIYTTCSLQNISSIYNRRTLNFTIHHNRQRRKSCPKKNLKTSPDYYLATATERSQGQETLKGGFLRHFAAWATESLKTATPGGGCTPPMGICYHSKSYNQTAVYTLKARNLFVERLLAYNIEPYLIKSVVLPLFISINSGFRQGTHHIENTFHKMMQRKLQPIYSLFVNIDIFFASWNFFSSIQKKILNSFFTNKNASAEAKELSVAGLPFRKTKEPFIFFSNLDIRKRSEFDSEKTQSLKIIRPEIFNPLLTNSLYFVFRKSINVAPLYLSSTIMGRHRSPRRGSNLSEESLRGQETYRNAESNKTLLQANEIYMLSKRRPIVPLLEIQKRLPSYSSSYQLPGILSLCIPYSLNSNSYLTANRLSSGRQTADSSRSRLQLSGSKSRILLRTQNSTISNTEFPIPLAKTNFNSPFEGEIISEKRRTTKVELLILTKSDLYGYRINEGVTAGAIWQNNRSLTGLSRICVGKFLKFGDVLTKSNEKPILCKETGQIIHINNQIITIRRSQYIAASHKAILHVTNSQWLEKTNPVITLPFQRLKAGDIVQGIPKIEQFFEARKSKAGRFYSDSIPNLMNAIYNQFLMRYRLETNCLTISAKKAILKVQQILVNGIQRVYRTQGVSIADKHIEIIVRQMTSKVRILNPGLTSFLPGELIDVSTIFHLNLYLVEKVHFEPIVLGITQASLQVDSFISAASFQQTTRVLCIAAIEKKRDYLRGLKENIILGHLMPAGTGFRPRR